MIRRVLRRFGVSPIAWGTTLLTTACSVCLTIIAQTILDGQLHLNGILIAVITPLLLTPVFTHMTFTTVHRLDMAEKMLRCLSNTDDLTNTFNRRYFFECANLEFERAKRSGLTFTLALLDFDKFKDINDSNGHLAGDAVLKFTAGVCRDNIRQADIFARYGGDEFIFLFPETDILQAVECLEHILGLLKNQMFQFDDHIIPIKVSVGVSGFHATMESLDDVLREADFALYAAKRQGGMRVIAHPT